MNADAKTLDEAFTNIRPYSSSYLDLIGQLTWKAWTPVRTSWTDIGTPTVTARFIIQGRVCRFQIQVVPGTTVATVAGTSYVNLPVMAKGIAGEGSMTNLTTLIAIGLCVIDITNSLIYVPTQTATGNTLDIFGSYEV